MTDASFPGADWNNSPTLDTVEDDTIEETEVVEEAKPKPAKRASTRAAKTPAKRAPARKAAKGAVSKANVQRIVEKTIAVQELDTEDRELLASVLGTDDDTIEIVTSIVAGGAKAEGIAEAVEISEIDDDGERGIAAALLGTKLKLVWAVYNSLGLVAADAPEAVSKAAIALSKAAAEFAGDGAARARLDTVIEITQ